MSDNQVIFLVLPHVHALDLAGPAQVFYEANGFGGRYRLRYCGVEPRVRSTQGLWISDLEPLLDAGAGDRVLVAGIDSSTLDDLDHVPGAWLRACREAGAKVGSICSGAFALARAGLLNHRRCTTHWKLAGVLQDLYPETTVLRNRLFVEDADVVTSAGVASGIDMALSLVEADHGPVTAAMTARELVVYLRRDGSMQQSSIYLDYRTHLNPGVHRVQDWLIAHPERRPSIRELAGMAGMSARNLTRSFRKATGITLKEFASRLKLEVAAALLHDPQMTVEGVAACCGFRDARQLRRLWKQRFGVSPSAWSGRREGTA